MPLSAVIGRAEIMDAPQPGGIGGTYSGNPIANAAALATLQAYADENMAESAQRIEAKIREVLEPLVAELDTVGEVRGRGAMMAIELVKGECKTPNADLVKTVVDEALKQGVMFLTCGTYGNVIRLLPPLVISEELLDDALTVLETAIRTAAQGN